MHYFPILREGIKCDFSPKKKLCWRFMLRHFKHEWKCTKKKANPGKGFFMHGYWKFINGLCFNSTAVSERELTRPGNCEEENFFLLRSGFKLKFCARSSQTLNRCTKAALSNWFRYGSVMVYELIKVLFLVGVVSSGRGRQSTAGRENFFLVYQNSSPASKRIKKKNLSRSHNLISLNKVRL